MNEAVVFVCVCVSRVFIFVVLVLLVLWLVLDTRQRPEQLISFGGVCMFVVLIFLLSAHRTAVSLSVLPKRNNYCGAVIWLLISVLLC